jgi:hypothetical protein
MAATVISLDAYRARKDPRGAALRRLDLAVGRLDPLIRGREGRLSPRAELELERIAHAVSSGRTADAAERAERLADLLEHPAAHG